MRHKKKTIIFIILCFLLFTGAIGHKVEIVTDNGGPLIDLNKQLVNRDLLYAEEDDDDPETVEKPPVSIKKTVPVNIKYDHVSFYGSEYRYIGHEKNDPDTVEKMEKISGKGKDDFKEEVSDFIKTEGLGENDVFEIKGEYAEYYTMLYVTECLKNVTDEEKISTKFEFE